MNIAVKRFIFQLNDGGVFIGRYVDFRTFSDIVPALSLEYYNWNNG